MRSESWDVGAAVDVPAAIRQGSFAFNFQGLLADLYPDIFRPGSGDGKGVLCFGSMIYN
ncbi:hypothetical protein [Moorella sp. E306M]|uniref:hypothetical protein n=1 Tax=Moorella sp. E306M TaxID=2572683 RepID=UPI00155AA944|nr:hypothetical protein [Moorella sp. E306M]